MGDKRVPWIILLYNWACVYEILNILICLQLILLRQKAQQDKPGISFSGLFTVGKTSVLTVRNSCAVPWKHFRRYWPFVRGNHWSR